jgi:hypothetical protein
VSGGSCSLSQDLSKVYQISLGLSYSLTWSEFWLALGLVDALLYES